MAWLKLSQYWSPSSGGRSGTILVEPPGKLC
jgi:hypothetical protein